MSSPIGRSCDCISVSFCHIARRLDLVGHRASAPSFSTSAGQLTLKVTVSFSRGLAFDHLAADVDRAIRRADDERAADLQIDLDRIAGKILSAELRVMSAPATPSPAWTVSR